MTPERWKRLETLFEAAADRDPVSREAFLADACAGDPDLRRELDEVLRSHDLLSAKSAPITTLDVGSRLGRYEILSLLGAGGMGEVYRARDPQLGREVGIKILAARADVSGEQLKRFEREARAVGALNHSNILTVLTSASKAACRTWSRNCSRARPCGHVSSAVRSRSKKGSTSRCR
jgi:serine/threonine protein kinase